MIIINNQKTIHMNLIYVLNGFIMFFYVLSLCRYIDVNRIDFIVYIDCMFDYVFIIYVLIMDLNILLLIFL